VAEVEKEAWMASKILVVDDEPDLEILIKQRFRRQIRDDAFHFEFARNGVEALQKLDEHQDISLVLSDINMPEMDGLTLLQKLVERNAPTIKSVIISAYGDMENIRVAMNRGASDFLMKPIDFADLEATINKTLKQLEILKQALKDREQLLSVKNDLNTAARIQQSILPQKFPPFPDRTEFDVYAKMVPAKEVGGDFYDFFFLDDDRLAFLIGDVSGKGVSAAIFMAVSRTLLKAVAKQIVNPGETLRRINTMLIPEANGRMFVTVFYGILNTRTGEVQFSYGGQPPPYIKRADGSIERVEQDAGFLLGMVEDMEYDVHKVLLHPGDSMFLYTDGVTEALNREGQMFTEAELVQSLRRVDGAQLKDVLGSINEDVTRFSAGAPQADDITMLALQYKGKR
jgi:sigma-B regulation protein RsbU (phosphoserine phosphatase)